MQLALFDDAARFIQKTNELAEELEERVSQGIGVAPKGAHIRHSHGHSQLEAHDNVEKNSAVVVTEESCTGTRYFIDLHRSGGCKRRIHGG